MDTQNVVTKTNSVSILKVLRELSLLCWGWQAKSWPCYQTSNSCTLNDSLSTSFVKVEQRFWILTGMGGELLCRWCAKLDKRVDCFENSKLAYLHLRDVKTRIHAEHLQLFVVVRVDGIVEVTAAQCPRFDARAPILDV